MDKIIFCNQLRGLVQSEAWRVTVGAWLEEMRTQYTREMAFASSDEEVKLARGGYRALDFLGNRIQSLLEEGERLRLKANEKQ